MKRYCQLLVIVALGITSCKTPVKRPNIILIMTDDQGWFDVGFNGNTQVKTPWLDALASKGVIFDRFYSASAVCSPTRASLITGRNPLRMNIPYANTGHMLSKENTIPEILKAEGYTTGHFGKWHLGTLSKTIKDANRGGRPKFINEYSIPSQHGYDTFFCTESKVPTYNPMEQPASFKVDESLAYGWRARTDKDSINPYGTYYWKGENQIDTTNIQGDNSRIIMDRVIPFISDATTKKQAFFTTIWFQTPHLPVVSDSVYRSPYADLDLDKQLYYGTISAMDEQIGRLWASLGEAGLQEETLIFFCSDNGPERETPGSAGDFRDRKRSLYEGGVRVPAFAIWKDNIEGGKRIDFPAVTSDYLPTILDLLSINLPDKRPIDGISLQAALKGNVTKRTEPIGFICTPQVSWVTHQYKLITDEKGEHYELYDLLNDKSEQNNIIAANPGIAEQLKSELNNWLIEVEKSKTGADYN